MGSTGLTGHGCLICDNRLRSGGFFQGVDLYGEAALNQAATGLVIDLEGLAGCDIV